MLTWLISCDKWTCLMATSWYSPWLMNFFPQNFPRRSSRDFPWFSPFNPHDFGWFWMLTWLELSPSRGYLQCIHKNPGVSRSTLQPWGIMVSPSKPRNLGPLPPLRMLRPRCDKLATNEPLGAVATRAVSCSSSLPTRWRRCRDRWKGDTTWATVKTREY